MTTQKDKMLHLKMGQRLKQLAKEYSLTREDMSEIINYSCGHISRFYNGSMEIPDNAAQILSKLWNIRKEYILCEDDFKTDEEMYLYLKNTSIKEMQAAIDYLETLEVILRPQTMLSCSLTSLYKHFEQIKCYIKESEIQRLKTTYNFELSQKDFFKTYFSEECKIELSSPIPGVPFLCTENVSKTSASDDMILLYSSSENNPVHSNCEIALYFKVYYKNELIRSISTHDLQKFIKKLDMYSKCTIETILLDEDFGCHLPCLNISFDKNNSATD